jgi:hypothetical protein
MEHIVKIAQFNKLNDVFDHIGFTEYTIQYMRGIKPHQIRVVVNKVLTKGVINLVDIHQNYKDVILQSISDVKNILNSCK